MVAPSNYRRPTAIVTESMVKKAQKTIEDLGYTPSLKRRHATIDDIPVKHMLHVNRNKGSQSVFDSLSAEQAMSPRIAAKKAIAISVKDFIAQVLPEAAEVSLLLENGQNFVSLIAPVDPDAKNILSWSNNISWTYQNNMTDVLKEKVKNAGGRTDAELRISLEWFNYDDLDLHVVEPGGNRIYFRSKYSQKGEGSLDVDMNAGGGVTREPVENVAYTRAPEGVYRVVVHNFCKRENIDGGFNIQIESQGGELRNLNYTKKVIDNAQVEVATFKYSRADGITNFKTELEESCAQRESNNVVTNRFQRVNMITYSPNYWSDKVGHQHLFFIMENARVDNELRPFFNEFLTPELYDHRKVFELLGSKLLVDPEGPQLTGVGFSMTQRLEFIVKVDGKLYKVAT